MSQPPQTYELTTFSTLVVLCISAIFFVLIVKTLLGIVQWLMGRNSKSDKTAKDEIKTTKEDDEEEDEDEADGDIDNTLEPADLDTKKGN